MARELTRAGGSKGEQKSFSARLRPVSVQAITRFFNG